MSRIFISHSNVNSAEAVAMRDWLRDEGWDDVFLDIDTTRGIAAGDRWERALNEAARRCEAVIFLVSHAWLASDWCERELNLAHRLNKRLFGVLIEELTTTDIPPRITATWQLVQLASGCDHIPFDVTLPITGEKKYVTFSEEGLKRLKAGLTNAGLDPCFFAWPPESEPERQPYRGLRSLEAEDAGIFFGREAEIIEALDKLRGLSESAPPRLFVILGASGAGKSSFMRAGLWPRLKRDDRNFLPLPFIRPGRAAISGDTGLIRSLEDAFKTAGAPRSRADIRKAVEDGPDTLAPLLVDLAAKNKLLALYNEVTKTPQLVFSIDQGEELFLPDGKDEAQAFLMLLRNTLSAMAPSCLAVITIRTNDYESLQTSADLEIAIQHTFSLPPLAKGAYINVIEGPARRLAETPRALKIEPALSAALLADLEAGGAKDALPLLAFTLERLYGEYGGKGRLVLDDYKELGRVGGSIEAAVELALKMSDTDPAVPRDRAAKLALLRRGLIPWLAGIDPDTGLPRRRVARFSEIPKEAGPLIGYFVKARLLSIDKNQESGEITIEPSHETLLRQWGLLQGWLREDAGLLTVLDGIKRASRDWAANAKTAPWLAHTAGRLQAAEQLMDRPDLAANLEPTDRDYVKACQNAVREARIRARHVKIVVGALATGILAVVGLAYVGLFDRNYLEVQARRLADIYLPTPLSNADALALKPGKPFKECASCPEMIVVPAGEFLMGSQYPEGRDDERPQHKVTIANAFAVSKFEITFDEWDGCVAHGVCKNLVKDPVWGRGLQPIIKVTWDDAKAYASWLTKQTGGLYRLLTEAEWEYVARAGLPGRLPLDGSKSALDKRAWYDHPNSNVGPLPVGSRNPNEFGLFDVLGNVWEWVEDCYKDSYDNAPADGMAVELPNCHWRVLRGGAMDSELKDVSYTKRYGYGSSFIQNNNGFRVARALIQP